MDIFDGKCVICSESTLVLSGKDKQKFVELLKEHYFDVNHINDNKFLMQFKEKRSAKSICMACAYIIECYVSVRKKYKEKTGTDRKCSICNKDSNLTNGNNQLMNDAHNLLKDSGQRKKFRLKHICLECCFCIISWNKIKDIITKYTLNGNDNSNELNGIKKRRHSAADSSESESDSSVAIVETPTKRTRGAVKKGTEATVENGVRKGNKLKKVKNKRDQLVKTTKDDLDKQLTHLSNVNTVKASKDICISGQMAKKVTADDRMMFDIPHVSLKSNNLETLRKCWTKMDLTDSDDSSLKSTSNKNKRKKASKETSQSEVSDDTNSSKVIKNKKRKSVRLNEKSSNVIIISDTEDATTKYKKKTINNKTATPLRASTRISKSSSAQYVKPKKPQIKIKYTSRNECSFCNKSFLKKYKLKLHELEHEASFKPVVLVNKENEKANGYSSDADSEDNENEGSRKDIALEEKEILKDNSDENNAKNVTEKNKETEDNNIDESVKQAIDATLSQVEEEVDKNTEKPQAQEEDNEESLSKEKEVNEHDESSRVEEQANSDEDTISNKTKEKELDDMENKTDNTADGKETSNKEDTSFTNAESEKMEEDTKIADETTEQATEKQKDIAETSNEDSKKETADDVNQQSETEKDEEIITEESLINLVEENGKEKENDTDIETNETNVDKAESEECVKQNEENTTDRTNNIENKNECNAISVIDSDEENDVQKTNENKKNNSVVNDDDASNISNVVENEKNEENTLKSIEIEDDSSNNSDSVKTDKQNNHEPILIEDDSSSSFDKTTPKKNHNSVVNEDDPLSDKNENNDRTKLSTVDDSIKISEEVPTDKQNAEKPDNDKTLENEVKLIDECEDTNSQSTVETNYSADDESDMGPLKLSPESVSTSPKKQREVVGSNTQISTDKYEIVENLLQNLGA